MIVALILRCFPLGFVEIAQLKWNCKSDQVDVGHPS